MSNATELATVEILFDNGGGTTLQTETFAHHYDDATDAARDYKELVSGSDTGDWDGNNVDSQVTKYMGYRFYDHAEIQAILKKDEQDVAWNTWNTWNNERAFFKALGVKME